MNQKYNSWTVLSVGLPDKKTGKRLCVVRCECGRLHTNDFYNVKSGKTKMCKACSAKLTKNRTTHGMTGTRLNRIWQNMKFRCANTNDVLYGGRGISVCTEWVNNFMSFYNWAITHGYQNNLTIDRIDVNGNYCPENCRWATVKEQTRNTRRNHYVLYKNKRLTISELAETYNIKYDTLWARLNRGYCIEDAIKGIR